MSFIKYNLLLFFVLISSFSSFSQKIDFRSDSLDMKHILKSIFIKNDTVKKKGPSKVEHVAKIFGCARAVVCTRETKGC